jgi:hypothetical protein
MKMQALDSQLGSMQPTSMLSDRLFEPFPKDDDRPITAEQPLGNMRFQLVTHGEQVERSWFEGVFFVEQMPAALEPLNLWRVVRALGESGSSAKVTTSMSTPTSKLEELKQQQVGALTQNERIAKALAALDAPSVLHFTKDQWKDAADNPELEEEE